MSAACRDEEAFTARLPSELRNWFLDGNNGSAHTRRVIEPVLGTLQERQEILARRLRGRVSTPRATADERREYARWLAQNGLENTR